MPTYDTTTRQAELEALMVDTVRISRPRTGGDGASSPDTVYEGPGALLSTHGQLLVTQILGVDWAGESAAWYQLLTPLASPPAEPGDHVTVVAAANETAAFEGRTWYAEARTQASTWELARVTRLDEQGGTLGQGL
ncbi:DUF6093 family protein [Streptomyces sp. CA-210063]|uniref:DUF6093 family protein n=1 Tax=Streptomyces TaxID=1883 RepID=UPI00214C70E3|nr:DUF6093 family protein [Streptomyces sp. CA-210063]UUU31965.1 DUF6093 family protein [Streptomyces sp. CA-210063]